VKTKPKTSAKPTDKTKTKTRESVGVTPWSIDTPKFDLKVFGEHK
jgi:hypothetical protein